MGVPTYYIRLLAEPGFDRAACRNMRLFISGSAPLLSETFHAFRERSGHTILERYGMSETNMLTSNPYQGERVAGTVGLPLPGVAVRVVNQEGAPCAPGQIGDIQVQGPNVFQGYWRMPEKTAEEFTADGLLQDRRRRQIRRARLSLHRRPQQGFDHLRRLQRLPEGNRVGDR